jgi:myosin heavy subunit
MTNSDKDASFASNVVERLGGHAALLSSARDLQAARASDGGVRFGIRHFGSVVFYNVHEFTAKNADEVDSEIVRLLPFDLAGDGSELADGALQLRGASSATPPGSSAALPKAKTVSRKLRFQMDGARGACPALLLAP